MHDGCNTGMQYLAWPTFFILIHGESIFTKNNSTLSPFNVYLKSNLHRKHLSENSHGNCAPSFIMGDIAKFAINA